PPPALKALRKAEIAGSVERLGLLSVVSITAVGSAFPLPPISAVAVVVCRKLPCSARGWAVSDCLFLTAFAWRFSWHRLRRSKISADTGLVVFRAFLRRVPAIPPPFPAFVLQGEE
ncbi:unnamed protein product, partial [Ectocarpus sp. 13 AM-2016]